MMLMEASCPSNNEAAVTNRTGFTGVCNSATVQAYRALLIGFSGVTSFSEPEGKGLVVFRNRDVSTRQRRSHRRPQCVDQLGQLWLLVP